MKPCSIAIVGATGAVGREILKTLEQRKFPVSKLGLFSSFKSAGNKVHFLNNTQTVAELKEAEQLKGWDYIFFAAGSKVSERWVPVATDLGARVIDNSSFFRMQKDVPLIIPEVNGKNLKEEGLLLNKKLFANPNCTTAIALMAVEPLKKKFGLKRLCVASYQAVSGKGQQGIDELEEQLEQWSKKPGGKIQNVKAFPKPIRNNVLPHIDRFLESGYTGEEQKVIDESRKILNLPELRVSATCVRVPVLNGHSEVISIETEQLVTLAEAQDVLKNAPGVVLHAGENYPTPLEVSGEDAVHVGRLRVDVSVDRGLTFWVVGDNLRKGAALNAVQIAELLLY